MESGKWSTGEELRVAAALLNSLHILPLPDDMGSEGYTGLLKEVLNIVIKLEAVRYKYRYCLSAESPFLAPLCRILSKHPIESVFYLLDPVQLARNEVLHKIEYSSFIFILCDM